MFLEKKSHRKTVEVGPDENISKWRPVMFCRLLLILCNWSLHGSSPCPGKQQENVVD